MHLGGDRRVGRLPLEQLDDPAGAVRVVDGERALETGADDRDVLPTLPRSGDDERRG